VLLHPWIESSRCFDRLAPLLPPSLHVLAFDQRGHGEADAPDDGYDLDSLGADVEDFMDALRISSAVLVGSSSGGYVAQQVAVRSPARVERLVLIGSPLSLLGRPDFADEVDALVDPIDPVWVRSFIDGIPRWHAVPDWYLEDRVREAARIPARVWQQSMKGLTASTPPQSTGSIMAPTLILWGERDDLLDRDEQEALARSIPGASLRTYPGVGHLVLWEEPARVAAEITGFLLR
jgi:pimeloyl-ACP methyl ester carboxylesterase